MKLTIAGPNLGSEAKAEFYVHADNCADLKRSRITRNAATFVVDVETYEEVAEIVYEDIIAENPGSSAADYLSEFHFAPCVNLRGRDDCDEAKPDPTPEMTSEMVRALLSIESMLGDVESNIASLRSTLASIREKGVGSTLFPTTASGRAMYADPAKLADVVSEISTYNAFANAAAFARFDEKDSAG